MLVMLMMVGCGPSWDRFVNKYPDAYCAQQEDCIGDTPESNPGAHAECVENYRAAMPADPAYYDPAAAADCLDVLAGAACKDDDAVDDACGAVFAR